MSRPSTAISRPAVCRKWRGGHLAGRIAAEDRLLAEPVAQQAQSLFDRGVELADRLVVVALGRGAGRRRLFDPQEHLERFGAEGDQRQLQGAVAVGQRPGMRREHLRRVQPRPAADGVEQVRRQSQVQHLLGEDAAHHLVGLRVALRVQRVQRAQVRRQGRSVPARSPTAGAHAGCRACRSAPQAT